MLLFNNQSLPWISSPDPEPVIDGVIQPAIARLGPRVKPPYGELRTTSSLLFNLAQLSNCTDPAGFLNARIKAMIPSATVAVWVDPQSGRVQAEVNPASIVLLSEAEEAAEILLRKFGLSVSVIEVPHINPFSVVDWTGRSKAGAGPDTPPELRRFYGLSIGSAVLDASEIRSRFVRYPEESALMILKDEFRDPQILSLGTQGS